MEERRATYYPYRVYCERCHKDSTTIIGYDEANATISYVCHSCNELVYPQLPEQDRAGIRMLVQVLDEHWNLESLTALVYSIPKLVRNLPTDTVPNEELKQAQRSFFIAIYQLICGRETGPRIPTLLLSLGKEKVKALLSPEGLSFEA